MKTENSLDLEANLDVTPPYGVTRAVEHNAAEGLARDAATERLLAVGHGAAEALHDALAPLAVLPFLADQLRARGVEINDSAMELLTALADSARAAALRARHALAYARVPAEDSSLVSLVDVIRQAQTLVGPVAARSGTRLVLRVEGDGPIVSAPLGDLTQVFTNLFTNACHAVADADLGPTGEIVVTVESRPGGGCGVVLRDNGCGIREQDLPRIFEPFFSTRPPGRGSGLGLAIVRSTLARIGARISVESWLGRGTRVALEFPAPRAAMTSRDAARLSRRE